MRYLVFIFATLVLQNKTSGSELNVACASSFKTTLQQIAKEFTSEYPEISIQISSGSTGKLYFQITQGAPYHVFLSADSFHVSKLIQQGLAVQETARTYALGRLAIWGPGGLRGMNPIQVLKSTKGCIALANPKTAPYGQAASSFLANHGLQNTLHDKLIFTNDVGQVAQLLVSKTCDVGFVSLAQTKFLLGRIKDDQVIALPSHSHEEIRQLGVLLKSSSDNRDARAFFDFLVREKTQALIRNSGFEIPKIGG